MQIDSFFTKGVSHKICEDYTMHGIIKGNPYIIVCDGCSGSDETDFGARLLARAAKEAIRHLSLYYNDFYNDFYNDDFKELFDNLEYEIKFNVNEMIKSTNSSLSVIDATLLIAFNIDDKVFIYTRGDGTFAYKTTDGILNIETIEFKSGAPFYLSYDLSSSNLECYKNTKNDKKVLTSSIFKNGDCINNIIENVDYDFRIFKVIPLKDLEFISLMSDGVSAFQFNSKFEGEKNNLKLSTNEIVRNMVAYKNYAGEFVDRRMNRMMKDLSKEGIENFDDVSSATIYF